jgi:predicted DNA binding CopG/RHH family protein
MVKRCSDWVLGPKVLRKELLESVERGEWKSAGRGKRERTRYARYAKATFREDRRLNIRLSSKDLEAIQKRGLAEGLPCPIQFPHSDLKDHDVTRRTQAPACTTRSAPSERPCRTRLINGRRLESHAQREL